MIYCFDIDGTLCTNTNGEYESAEPYSPMIASVNALYDANHTVKLYTARGSTTGIDWKDLTRKQLKSWGVKYHHLIFNKPDADIYVDDKAMDPGQWLKSQDVLA